MSPESLNDQASSRQDQILRLAAEGMTDKEIAGRLSLSPETVGTYWRRILSKYSAASRTEVVAKVVRLQAESQINEVEVLNECLREVTDHLLIELSGRQQPDNTHLLAVLRAAFQGLSIRVFVLDDEGFVRISNIGDADAPSDDPFEWLVDEADRSDFRDALTEVLSDDVRRKLSLRVRIENGKFSATLSPLLVGDHRYAIIELSADE
jgi:DNA-binding CsgD family transcriptional regulator